MTRTMTALTICLTLALTAITACDQSDAPPSATDGMPTTQPTTQPGSDMGKVDMHVAAGPPASNTACPLSGDPVDPKVATAIHGDKVYGFCCEDCVDAFKANPAKYVQAH